MSLPPLAVAALAFLVERPMHPYEMYSLMLKRREDRVVKVSAGTLYRAVEKLRDSGLAEEVGVDRAGNRPERTTYRATEQGREQLGAAIEEMLAAPAEEYPQFPLALSQATLLPATVVSRLLGERETVLRRELALLAEGERKVRSLQLPESRWLDIGYRRAMLLAQLDWLTATRRRIAADEVAW